ncbi:uncharacterized protein RHOBADRAFT_54954 [Rhodotorula graminis WP1]|uniref:DUF6534 domain-containing protein n=1 Tax=Rhodotorula graminis (strain WP1) TaxID=578459 RepID=A0A0P9EJJ3_RHOGW|nr:uncharacterized protein RHOBADRAFT_54954 [Rhodotorula graminis WP1]KPV73775.1 hypothetical protein RHOBADRAFT_54954 [Rhodotorula graminis WP1]
MADPNPPGAPNIDPITGPVILGQVAAVMMYGVLLSEFSSYLHSPAWRRSGRGMRWIICGIVLSVTASVGLAIHDIFFYGTLPTDDLQFILHGTDSQAIEPILAGVIAFSVHLVLIQRVLSILPSRWVRWTFGALVGTGALLGLLASCMYGAIGVLYHNYDFTGWPWQWERWFSLWLWSVAAVDVLVTSVYVWALCKRLSGGTQLRQSVLRLLVLAAVRTAMYTAVLAVVAAVLGEIWGINDPYRNFICYAFWEPLPPLYALSLFTTLSVADNVVARLGDPTLRKHDRAESVLPRFAGFGTGGSRSISFGATSWVAERQQENGGEESRSADGGGGKSEGQLEPGASLVRPHSGVFVQVEMIEHDERDSPV